jgi:hypothetical protein
VVKRSNFYAAGRSESRRASGTASLAENPRRPKRQQQTGNGQNPTGRKRGRKEAKMDTSKKFFGKKTLILGLTLILALSLIATSAFAVAPTPPYFYLNLDLTQLPRMGNATVSDVSYDYDRVADIGYLVFQFQTETWTDPDTGIVYDADIDQFEVNGIDYFDSDIGLKGGARVPIDNVVVNRRGDLVLPVTIGVYVTTGGVPVYHPIEDVYFHVPTSIFPPYSL